MTISYKEDVYEYFCTLTLDDKFVQESLALLILQNYSSTFQLFIHTTLKTIKRGYVNVHILKLQIDSLHIRK